MLRSIRGRVSARARVPEPLQGNTNLPKRHERSCRLVHTTHTHSLWSTYLWLKSHNAKDEESLGGINKVREVPEVVRSTHQPRDHVQDPGDAHHHHQLHAHTSQGRSKERERESWIRSCPHFNQEGVSRGQRIA